MIVFQERGPGRFEEIPRLAPTADGGWRIDDRKLRAARADRVRAVTAHDEWPLFKAIAMPCDREAQCSRSIISRAIASSAPQDVAASVLGLVIIVYCAFAFWQPALRLTERQERAMQIPVGLLNGLINGFTGSQIIPLVPFMLSLRLDAERFVQAVNIGFTLSSLVMVFGLGRVGLLNQSTFLISVAGIIPAILGSWLGGILRRHLPEARFRLLVLSVLMVLGAILVSRLFGRLGHERTTGAHVPRSEPGTTKPRSRDSGLAHREGVIPSQCDMSFAVSEPNSRRGP